MQKNITSTDTKKQEQQLADLLARILSKHLLKKVKDEAVSTSR